MRCVCVCVCVLVSLFLTNRRVHILLSYPQNQSQLLTRLLCGEILNMCAGVVLLHVTTYGTCSRQCALFRRTDCFCRFEGLLLHMLSCLESQTWATVVDKGGFTTIHRVVRFFLLKFHWNLEMQVNGDWWLKEIYLNFKASNFISFSTSVGCLAR